MFQNIQLEMSLKPFRQTDDAYIQAVCEDVFKQWRPFVKDCPTVSVMLWTADGSEILDYKSDMDESFEWCDKLGGANPQKNHSAIDPDGIGLHSRYYFYMQHPPKMTYGILRKIVAALKDAGHKILGEEKNILIGETFDVGPEFAISPFKYERHPEICFGGAMGWKCFVCSYATLHADTVFYAGFPTGIPEGLPFGTFFGRQSQHFLRDLGFDFIWFSNGLGFGRDTWSTTGATFDGKDFKPEELAEVKRISLEFWRLFSAECTFPVQTRGTNMSTGIDFSTDAVPLAAIYQENPGMLPPPNSPWAALDGDYGLELMGYMSRIAELPGNRYLFRYYIHDPWWVNSPWYDRYGGQPHDIYLPLACTRIDESGHVQAPTDCSLLSIDNSFGERPDSCVNEPVPHMLKAIKDAPDAPSPFVWVYPFREYNESTTAQQLNDMFSEDWFVRNIISSGFPLCTIVSTDNFLKHDKSIYRGSVLVTPVPAAGTAIEAELLRYADDGGRIIFYGRPERASEALQTRINVAITDDAVEGDLPITVRGQAAGTVRVEPLVCAGALNTVLRSPDGAWALAEAGGKVVATVGTNVIRLRGIVSSSFTGGARLQPHDRTKYYIADDLAREAAAEFGWDIRFDRMNPASASPVNLLYRCDNALMLSTFSPDVTVGTRIRTPLGAPVPIGYEVPIKDGASLFRFPKSEHREVRVFVEQADGFVECHEMTPVSYQFRRRIGVTGLKDATVRLFGEAYCADRFQVLLNTTNADFCFLTDPIDGNFVTDENGTYFEMRHVTGAVTFSMPRDGIWEQ